MTLNLPHRHDDLCNCASDAAESINNNYIHLYSVLCFPVT